jgi:trimeric autotransporter adhesin
MATLDTLQDSVNSLTSSTTTLVTEVQTKKATLYASVANSVAARDASQSARDTALGYKSSAEAAAASATNTAASLVGFDLAAISDTIAATAVDVFVYDTSKDSDGGAWRKRTQGTSWYNEALNTATRGNRKEFPAVAVIVAETNKVTIYDGDDPALPMWRVTNQIDGVVPQFWRAGRSATSLYALNGKLVIGIATDTPAGLAMIDFAADLLFRWSSGGTSGGTLSGVSNDASATATLSGVLPALVSTAVNDVAMTVLPNAPIDAATGLPVPTIAVATAGGVSVITDSGAVWDLTYTIVNVESGSVFFPASGGISWSSRSSSGYVYLFREFELPTADKSTAPDKIYGTSGQVSYWPPAIGSYNVINAIDGAISGTGNGLTHLAEDPVTPANGMVAYTTSSYNTGWMNGDIKGAFLSDTDATSVVGSGELVTNGTFASNTTGWTAANGAALAVVSGELRITANGTSTPLAKQTITTVVGKEYVISATARRGTCVNPVRVDISGISGAGSTSSTANTTISQTFIATSTSHFAEVYIGGSTSNGETAFFDNVSVRLAEADRSVNKKGLQVFGTIIKTVVATGADLVGYSGWSPSNYLEQPYNSGLDFGTGNFSAMYWVKTTDTYYTALENRSDDTASGWNLNTATAGSTTKLVLIIAGTQASSGEVSQIVSGSWTHIVAQRVGTVVQFYVNGELVATDSSIDWTTKSATKADTTGLKIGIRRDGGQVLTGPLALLRISATAPSAAQIAKIYNDEKYLFQDGAQATLYGASDAVTALGYDDATDLLHVGTSQGRSVFQGLRRVSNTAVAVGTAISASNGLVVEE